MSKGNLCVSDTLFARNSRQASKQQNVPTLSLSIRKKKLLARVKRAGGVVVVVVTGCGKASGGFHHIWKEVRMRMYAREHDFSNKCRAFKRVSSGVCKRKGYELAAAAAAAGVNSLKRG